MTGILDTAMGYLATAAAPATPDDRASLLIQDAGYLGTDAYQLLQELNGADADQIPHQIVGPFQRWVDGLGIRNTIFFRADHVANYELARFNLQSSLKNIDDPAPTLTEAMAAVEWPFMRLTVPSQALGMLPHFAIVGHELGHAIDERIGLAGPTLDPSACFAALDARLASEGQTRTLAVDVLFHKVVASWIQEFKSDAVGMLVAGPAFFLALGAFFEISGGGYGISPTHPPSDMRRRLILDRLAGGAPSHVEVFEEATGLRLEEDSNSPHLSRLPDADTLYAELKNEYDVEKAAICVALLPLAEELAASVYDGARAALEARSADMIYGADRLAADLRDHLEPLCDLVPPIETRRDGIVEAASLACNLNVGWAALLTRLDRLRVGEVPEGTDPDTRKMEKLHELLLKGVELAEARMMWDERA